MEVIKNFTVDKNTYTKNEEKKQKHAVKVDSNAIGEILEIDELDHRLQKLKDKLQSSTDTPTTSVNVNQKRIEQNLAEFELTAM